MRVHSSRPYDEENSLDVANGNAQDSNGSLRSRRITMEKKSPMAAPKLKRTHKYSFLQKISYQVHANDHRAQ